MGLAPILVEEIFNIIQGINAQGTSILLVEQNAAMALSVAHRGYVLETGSIVLEGSAQELLENPQVQAAYLGERSPALAKEVKVSSDTCGAFVGRRLSPGRSVAMARFMHAASRARSWSLLSLCACPCFPTASPRRPRVSPEARPSRAISRC